MEDNISIDEEVNNKPAVANKCSATGLKGDYYFDYQTITIMLINSLSYSLHPLTINLIHSPQSSSTRC